MDGTPHSPLTFWFCVDEEIGKLDISVVPEETVKSWDILWTIDGLAVGDIDVGCYHGQSFNVTFKGEMAHPGLTPEKIKPAHYVAADFTSKVNAIFSPPWKTDDDGSFVFVMGINGDATETVVKVIPRSFDQLKSDEFVARLMKIADDAAKLHGVKFTVENKLQYITTKTAIDQNPELLQVGIVAHEKAGVTCNKNLVKGGTDGAMANKHYPDLPAPNMGAGGFNFHSKQEFLVADQLMKVPSILMNVIAGYANYSQ